MYDSPKNVLFFCDDNFTDNRKRAKELLKAMISEGFRFTWSTQARVDVAKDLELVSLLKRAGCSTVFIGLESINPESLKTMKKGQTVDQIKEAVSVIRKHGIRVHGMFVFGFDNDTKQTIQETITFAKNSKITSTQFMLLTPFPGTDIYRQIKNENRLIFNDWSLFDAHHVVIRPKLMKLTDLQNSQTRGHEQFYSSMQLARRISVGDLSSFAIGLYARKMNRWWKKQNVLFCNILELLDQQKDVRLSIDYEQTINIPGIHQV